jgi:hypothetical protein
MTFLVTTMASILLPMAAATNQRTVTVVWVNYLDGRTLIVTTPAGAQAVGAFQNGGRLSVTIPISDSGLAVPVSWKAGHLSGSFTITSDTADYLRIDLKRSGVVGPYAVDQE